jgi:prepilin-type N-terminal cleavage/methylation domain-containing protein
MNNRAFTLLELLVVITIIGILSSIVIVSMSGSTDSATIAKGKTYAQQVHALLGANAAGVWNFDEGTGTTAYDISGYGNNGALNKGANGTGMDWVDSDIEGTALQFDGVDDYVGFSQNPSLKITDTVTLESWVFATMGTGDHTVVSRGYAYMMNAPYSNVIEIYGHDGVDSTGASISWNWTDQWIHIIGIIRKYNGSWTSRLYVNGELKKEGTSLNFDGPREWGEGISIGRLGGSNWRFFEGLIDEVRIYSEALPATEIQKHYVQGLEKLLSNQAITKAEYDQRMEEFKQSLVLYE